jgi:hypothetical protein
MQNGESAEIAVVGNDGVVGVSLFMGGESTSSRALVQSAGGAYRLTAQLMKEEFDRAGPVLHLFLRYTQALITQMVQTAACNRHHSLDQQLCRWLLLSLDRLQGTEMVMTQTLIAHMLGVPRPDSGARPRRAGEAHLRVLCGGQKGVRQIATAQIGGVKSSLRTASRLLRTDIPSHCNHRSDAILGQIRHPLQDVGFRAPDVIFGPRIGQDSI